MCDETCGLWRRPSGLKGLQQLSDPIENFVSFLMKVLIMNIQKNPYIFSFLPSFHQVTQKASLPAEPAVEWKWEAANDVSCSSQRIAFPVKYLDNWLISLNVI